MLQAADRTVIQCSTGVRSSPQSFPRVQACAISAVSRCASRPYFWNIDSVHSLAFCMPGEPVRRGPMKVVRYSSFAMTSECWSSAAAIFWSASSIALR